MHPMTVMYPPLSRPQCATGYLELADSVYDNDHMKRYTQG